MMQNRHSSSLFPHERLDAYVHSREFHRWVVSVRDRMPSRASGQYDQLYRASTSQMLNLAEGADVFSPGRKRTHFQIANGSGGECAAVLDVLAMEPDAPEDLAEGRRLLDLIAKLTVGLILKLR